MNDEAESFVLNETSSEQSERISNDNQNVSIDQRDESVNMNCEGIDENLEEKAKFLNLSATNVKSILHHIAKNPLVSMILGFEEDQNIADLILTRSKTKQLKNNENQKNNTDSEEVIVVPRAERTFLDINFEESDEDDEDYDPKKDVESNDKENSDSEIQLSSSVHNDSICEIEKNKFIDQPSFHTRSRGLSISSVEVSHDLPNDFLLSDIDNPDYLGFIKSLNDPNSYEGDEVDDPDYNILEDLDVGDILEKDELRMDRSTEIPKREVRSLLQDHLHAIPGIIDQPFPCSDMVSKRKNDLPMSPAKNLENEKIRTFFIACDLIDLIPPSATLIGSSINNPPNFTTEEINQLIIQFTKHVQLLTQFAVGCYDEPELLNAYNMFISMIKELDEYSLSRPQQSLFNISNLSACINTCNEVIELKDIRLDYMENLRFNKCDAPSSRTILVLAKSTAIIYPELMPQTKMCIFPSNNPKFAYEEECLLALAQYQFAHIKHTNVKNLDGRNRLISRHFLPIKTVAQIRNHMKNIRSSDVFIHKVIVEAERGLAELVFSIENQLTAQSGYPLLWNKNIMPLWLKHLSYQTITAVPMITQCNNDVINDSENGVGGNKIVEQDGKIMTSCVNSEPIEIIDRNIIDCKQSIEKSNESTVAEKSILVFQTRNFAVSAACEKQHMENQSYDQANLNQKSDGIVSEEQNPMGLFNFSYVQEKKPGVKVVHIGQVKHVNLEKNANVDSQKEFVPIDIYATNEKNHPRKTKKRLKRFDKGFQGMINREYRARQLRALSYTIFEYLKRKMYMRKGNIQELRNVLNDSNDFSMMLTKLRSIFEPNDELIILLISFIFPEDQIADDIKNFANRKNLDTALEILFNIEAYVNFARPRFSVRSIFRTMRNPESNSYASILRSLESMLFAEEPLWKALSDIIPNASHHCPCNVIFDFVDSEVWKEEEAYRETVVCERSDNEQRPIVYINDEKLFVEKQGQLLEVAHLPEKRQKSKKRKNSDLFTHVRQKHRKLVWKEIQSNDSMGRHSGYYQSNMPCSSTYVHDYCRNTGSVIPNHVTSFVNDEFSKTRIADIETCTTINSASSEEMIIEESTGEHAVNYSPSLLVGPEKSSLQTAIEEKKHQLVLLKASSSDSFTALVPSSKSSECTGHQTGKFNITPELEIKIKNLLKDTEPFKRKWTCEDDNKILLSYIELQDVKVVLDQFMSEVKDAEATDIARRLEFLLTLLL